MTPSTYLVQNRKFELLLLIALTLLVLLCRLPLLEGPLDDDSAANAYGGRLIAQGEPLYTSYHPGHHLPAIYYLNALAFLLLGDSAFAIRFFLALWLIPTAYLLYRLSRTFNDLKTSGLAVILFLLLTSDRALGGNSGELEMFANLPRLGAILLLTLLLQGDRASWQFSLVGLMGAICILFKAAHVSPLVLAGLMLTVKFWLQRREKGAATRWFKSFVWLGIGFTVGLLPVVAYFGLLDLLPRIGLVFSLGFGHVSSASVSPLFILLYPLLGLAIANLPWLIAGIAGALGLLLDKSVSFPHKILIPLWLLLSLVEVGFSRNPFTHYYLVLVPPLSLAAAWLLTRLYQAAQGAGWPKFAALAAPALLLLTISAAYLFVNGRYLYHYTLYQTGQETHRTFIRESWPTVGPMYVALQDISDYVQIHSKPEDRIYIWGEETQLYFLANRRCALDFIWPIYLTHPAIPSSETMPGRLLAPTTKLIIISQNDPPDWLVDGLAQNYRLAETISGRKIYQRIGCETCVESAAQ